MISEAMPDLPALSYEPDVIYKRPNKMIIVVAIAR